MGKINDETLNGLIRDFYEEFAKAKAARDKILDYLEDNYDIDTVCNAAEIEDENDWCYGIDTDKVENLIKERKEN